MNELIGLSGCKRCVEMALHIPFAKERPVGLLIVSQPGMGKSMLLSKFSSDNMIVVNDITGYGLEKILLDMQVKRNGYLIIPDLLRLMARSKGWQAFLTLTNILLEEGVSSVKRCDMDIQFQRPVNFGIVTAITKDIYAKFQNYFTKIGFSSRFGIFFYDYEVSDKSKIEDLIAKQIPLQNTSFQVKSHTPVDIAIPNGISEMIKRLGRMMANGKAPRFRAIDFTRRMVKANALINNRTEVNVEDIKSFFSLLPFFVPPEPPGTDLQYFILYYATEHGLPDEIREKLSKRYTEEEIENSIETLMNKGLVWNKIGGRNGKKRDNQQNN